MAWPWLTVAVKTIPWGTIVRRAPDIIDAASSLLATRKADQIAKHTAQHTETQLSEIRERLNYLENHDQETAKVVNQIAEQTQDIANGMEVLAAKIRLLTFVLGATSVVAIVAIAIAMP
jgi:hypothetical protein